MGGVPNPNPEIRLGRRYCLIRDEVLLLLVQKHAQNKYCVGAFLVYSFRGFDNYKQSGLL